MGLAAAYHAAKAGHAVQVFEADDRPGGMAAHFDFDGVSLERYYHFICKADHPTFELLTELGIEQSLRWRETSMGYFYQGRHFRWGDPLALLRFSPLDLLSRLRYGLHMLYCMKLGDWSRLDNLDAGRWIKKWIGQRAWNVLWEKLFALKFYEYSEQISAAWIWTRIRRIGTSRKSIFQEELGYLEGGTDTLIKKLVERIEQMQGQLHLSTPVSEVIVKDGAVSGLRAGNNVHACEAVISTVPLPLVPKLIPALPAEAREQYESVKNIGVVCVVH
jgi:protoporphyrinogen oxidase